MTTNIRRLGQKSSTLFTFFGEIEGGHHTIFILRFPAGPSRTVARPESVGSIAAPGLPGSGARKLPA